jgi:hypothetical protein
VASVRIVRFVVVGLLIAAVVSAVALAVDKQGAKSTKSSNDAPEVTVTVTGVLHATSDGYAVGSRTVGFGPPWYAAGLPLVKDNLGKTVTVTGVADDDDDLSVRTINGTVYRANGRPPWAGGPKHAASAAAACKAKAKSTAAAAKAANHDGDRTSSEKSDPSDNGPPPWAKAYGHRCKG